MSYRSKPTLVTSRGLLRFDDPSVTLNDLKEAFFKGKVSRGSVSRCLNNRPELKSEVIRYSAEKNLPRDDIRQAMTHFFNEMTCLPRCKRCERTARFNRMAWGYSTYCSAKCQNNDPEVRKRHEETNIRIYGVSNAAKSQSVKLKMKSTVQKKYGADCYLASEKGKVHLRNILMERYGVTGSGAIPGVKEKREATMLAKYGYKNALQNEEIKMRQEKTCLDRFGVQFPGTWKLKELAEASKRETYDKLKELFPEYEIQCSKESFQGVYGHKNSWKCLHCGEVFSKCGVPICRCQYKWLTQDEIFRFIKSICPDAVFCDRTILPGGMELDVYVPSRKIAFEYDGLYWHSESKGKGRNYHLWKTEESAKKGIRLIHIFEDEWIFRKTIVRRKIWSILGRRVPSIYARKCSVSELDLQTAARFLNKYHIQGASRSSVNLGLTYEGHLVAVCTFNPKSKKDRTWYLERYATINACRIQGGCGKLLAYFCNSRNPESIRTFADRRWSEGRMYDSIGFVRKSVTSPSYWYIPKGTNKRIHRFNLRKDNKKMFPIKYESGMTESELAIENGYSRIWDCGQIVYDYKPVRRFISK